MLITVAICTLNRSASLHRTLGSLAALQGTSSLDWEVVVVNNGCDDDTDQVIASFTGRLPLRRAFEPQRGHARARNRAIETAHGDYIVWTDDDVVMDGGWLAAYAEAFQRWPEAAVFGGRIIPRYEAPVVEWVRQCEALIGGAFAVRDLGAEPMPLTLAGGRIPYGANFALRATEQRAFRYNPDLGYGPGRRRLSEETELVGRIMRSGGVGYWVPKACVEHCIGRERQTTAYIARHYAALGETRVFLEGVAEATPLWFGVPRWLWRRLIEEWARYQFHRLVSPAPAWVPHLRDYSLAWGAIRYWRRRQKTAIAEDDRQPLRARGSA
jgi:glycosyltransferase involved in cell wall biosynthesis